MWLIVCLFFSFHRIVVENQNGDENDPVCADTEPSVWTAETGPSRLEDGRIVLHRNSNPVDTPPAIN